MRTTKAILALVTGALCFVMCSNQQATPPDPSKDAPWLQQLVGKWEGDLDGMRYVEEWRKLDATTYEGTTVTSKGERVLGTEQIRITLFSDHWLYLANPGGQGVTCFVRNSDDATTWIFENREHDFPKRIGYRLQGDALTAWIAGNDDQDQRMEFALKRVK
jgi:hypothetical protein